MNHALVVDDEKDICELIEMALMGQYIEFKSAFNVKTAIKLLKENRFDVVFCDVRLPDGDGLDLLAHIQKQYPNTPVCMITAHGNMDMAIRALKIGAFDFINKPFELKQLRTICRSALSSQPKNKKDNGEPRKTALIGEAPVMEKVRALIAKVARSQAPVFIHGESGTGKEVAARSIHEQSNRADGAFIAVNCGAIPENLVESEFFGYKKGSFTGANQDTDGLFVAANGGTLFLDEVADLPLSMQVKLLRAIQERAVRPIGGDKEEKVDVRIISATHDNLAEKVQLGEFREDLYYRLNVVALTMPPLRDRTGDVNILTDFLLKKLAEQRGYPLAKLTDEALNKLNSYAFPGNVRELENILERALTFMDGEQIEAEDIHLNLALQAAMKPAATNEEEDIFFGIETKSNKETEPNENNDGGFQNNIGYVSNNPPPLNAFSFQFHDEQTKQTTAPSSQTPPPTIQKSSERVHKSDEKAQEMPDDLEGFMQEMERKLLIKALKENGNNKTKAAESLGISFRAMRYKLKKLGID
ncbi:sigma-54-dependent transcriptional regulator [Dichelobacter nodosus]|uniref:Two-component response regulator PilR n=2 Tax=Dichelobacter nodosus TaxID=870 RepID=A5EVU6_DICNV|nr:sigma-54 dependent transcriptional regulator [Dichelobacter nodosus]ABQ13152.1 two-component response regulator PilR [Dichelobacter nodosus VCS1703A]